MIKRKGEELEMLLLKEKIEIIKYEPKYKQQVQKVCIFQSTSRYKDYTANKTILSLNWYLILIND